MAEQYSSDSWERGDPYERYMGRWSRQVATHFLAWMGVPGGQRWLDLGCGTGALAGAILDCCTPSSVTAVELSAGFLHLAQKRLTGQVDFIQGNASAIPLASSCVDVTSSGLVLNFFPDQRVAFSEMIRVTKNGGIIAAYVWDYAERMDYLRYFWEAAAELDPAAILLDEGRRFPICNPQALIDLFKSGGLQDVQLTGIEVPLLFRDFEDFWDPFLGGQGPAPAYAMSLDEARRGRLREQIRRRLPLEADGSILLSARAWAVRAGVVK